MSFAPKRPFLVAILLILCVPVTLCTAFVIWYFVDLQRFANGSGPVSEVSVAEVGGLKLKLQLERRYAHPFLPEYLRTLTVTGSNGAATRHDLGRDTGSAGKLALCETAPGEILLTDSLYAYLLSADGTLQPRSAAPADTPACSKPLGAFDKTGDKSYGFVPS
jgi:hypothetical protein